MATQLSTTFVQAWYKGAWWLYLLFPFALLYLLVTFIRRMFFTMGMSKSYKSSLPVIVVGNISLGGTGKSPLVSFLVKSLQEKGFRPGIISRGYGADIASTECREVLPQSLPAEVGDEPLMLKKRLGCPVYVSPNRRLSLEALEQAGCDIVIADDGMQNYAMQRDVEICVFDGERKLGNGHVLPMGPLRESSARVASVDFCVVNGSNWQPEARDVTKMTLVPGAFLSLDHSEKKEFKREVSIHAIAAIGNPDRFFETLRKMGLKLESHAFDDHHAFIKEDFDFADGKPLVMTEKDAVKCASFQLENAWYLPVEAELDSPLVDKIIGKLKQKGYFNG